MGIPRSPGLMYATDGSQEKGNMGAGFYRHEGETGGFCKVGRDEEGSSSNRLEHAAACIALEVAIAYASSGKPRWTSLRQRPIFTWTTPGVAHRSTMSNVVKTRAHLMAARLQLREHDNLTAKFLKREGSCRSVLGDHWKDKRVTFRAKRCLLQSISFQFPCAANLKK